MKDSKNVMVTGGIPEGTYSTEINTDIQAGKEVIESLKKKLQVQTITAREESLFKEIASEAGDWAGSPVWNPCGDKTKADNALLGSLVKKGLCSVTHDEVIGEMKKNGKGYKRNKIQYVSFTQEGKKLAISMGFSAESFEA